ncbi:[Fe-Fe] hydrogenase large subunit C-terminal domain-containing protein [Clostridium vitabionis]|uniref:[Fe-Fe] hydrogenase large subunit C-terminal domain-containing protein n=1 Tax=Clostridium vitabionis TaxID=2784388 RepID=UPI00188AF942|nr:[Fe-Fe] hydrogenase large subunit C-terminal domain-containing protein [Clostridium vitabionis]
MPIIDFKEAKCRDCYRCVRSCEVKSIAFRNGRAFILPNRCILCGQCLVNCPQSAKRLSSELDKVKELVKSGRKIVLSVSPAYLGVFGVRHARQFITAMKMLGFAEVRDAAEGCAIASEHYVRLLNNGTMTNIISASCPSIISLIEMHYPQLIPYMAPIMRPAGIHVRMLKQEFGEETPVVYLGPCVAEKDKNLAVLADAVLTFEEIRSWMKDAGIRLETCMQDPYTEEYLGVNTRYAMSGGMLDAIQKTEDAYGLTDTYKKLYASGVHDCMEICDALVTGEFQHCFIELDACHGGCINGPVSSREGTGFRLKLELQDKLPEIPADIEWIRKWRPVINPRRTFSDCSVKEKMPTEEQIREIMRRTGKYRPDQELNCAACGYPTCRDKAIAVFQGKAELEMCAPYLHQRASSLAHMVMETSPYAILVLNQDLQILECSKAVFRFFGVKKEEVCGKNLSEFTDTSDVLNVFETHTPIQGKRVIYPEKNLVTFQNIAYIPETDYVIMTIIDVTEEEKNSGEEYRKRKATIDLAQDVIYRQMTVAQQIAGLLGETTAETQTMLTKLCSMFETENESEVR